MRVVEADVAQLEAPYKYIKIEISNYSANNGLFSNRLSSIHLFEISTYFQKITTYSKNNRLFMKISGNLK